MRLAWSFLLWRLFSEDHWSYVAEVSKQRRLHVERASLPSTYTSFRSLLIRITFLEKKCKFSSGKTIIFWARGKGLLGSLCSDLFFLDKEKIISKETFFCTLFVFVFFSFFFAFLRSFIRRTIFWWSMNASIDLCSFRYTLFLALNWMLNQFLSLLIEILAEFLHPFAILSLGFILENKGIYRFKR